MKKLKYKFQTRDFVFPKTAYVACVSAKPSGKRRYVFLTRVFGDFEVLRNYVFFVMDEFFKDSEDLNPSYDGYYIKIKQDRSFSLKKEHWQNTEKINLKKLRPLRSDINIIKYWPMCEVLVTPDGETNGVEFFSFCASLFKGCSDKDITTLIQTSEHAVDIRAKYASFYTLNKPVKINWLENTKKDFPLLSKIEEELVN